MSRKKNVVPYLAPSTSRICMFVVGFEESTLRSALTTGSVLDPAAAAAVELLGKLLMAGEGLHT